MVSYEVFPYLQRQDVHVLLQKLDVDKEHVLEVRGRDVDVSFGLLEELAGSDKHVLVNFYGNSRNARAVGLQLGVRQLELLQGHLA